MFFDTDKIKFSLTDINGEERKTSLQIESEKMVKDKKIYRKYLKKIYDRVENFKHIADHLPADGEQLRLITMQSFNSVSILIYLCEKVQLKNVFFTTFSADKSAIEILGLMLETENIQELTILGSTTIKTAKPKRYYQLTELAEKYRERCKIILAFNHTKIMGCETIDRRFFVFEGSGNLSQNARIEQYLFEQSEETYNFHKSWIDDIKLISASKDLVFL